MRREYAVNKSPNVLSVTRLIISVCLLKTHDCEPCRRLYFQNLAHPLTGYYHLDGVYTRTHELNDGFPVYTHARSSAAFLFSSRMPGLLQFVNHRRKYAGIYFEIDPTLRGRAILESMTNRTYPLADVVRYDRTFLYNIVSRSNELIKVNVTPVCVDERFGGCESDLYFDPQNRTLHEDGTVFNDPEQDRLQRVDGVIRNLRPVYQHSRKGFYMFHGNSLWMWGFNYKDPTRFFAYVRDSALRPDQILSVWRVYNGTAWVTQGDTEGNLGILSCKRSRCTKDYQCGAGHGRCVSWQSSQKVTSASCICASEYTGDRCGRSLSATQCLNPRVPQNVGLTLYTYTFTNYRDGDFATFLCDTNAEKTFAAHAICYRNTWHYEGTCGTERWRPRFASTTTPYLLTSRRWRGSGSFISSGGTRSFIKTIDGTSVYIPIVLFASLLQVFGFWIHYTIVYCVGKNWLSSRKKRIKFLEGRHAAVNNAYDNRLEGAVDPLEALSQHNDKLKEIQKELETITTEIETASWFRKLSLFRLLSLHMFVSQWLWVVYMVVYSSLRLSTYDSSLLDTLATMAIVFIVICYLIVLIEFPFSREMKHLRAMKETGHLNEYVEGIRAAKPELVMSVVCYHFETRTRLVTYTDSNGNLQTRTETYQEKVVTHTASDVFHFARFTDLSATAVSGVAKRGVTRVTFKKSVKPGDTQTESKLREAEEQFQDRYRNYDTYMDYELDEQIPGFIERMSAFNRKEDVPFWMNVCFYVLATLYGLSWIYRLLFRSITPKTGFTFVKEVFI